jgi:hypothetical protein
VHEFKTAAKSPSAKQTAAEKKQAADEAHVKTIAANHAAGGSQVPNSDDFWK